MQVMFAVNLEKHVIRQHLSDKEIQLVRRAWEFAATVHAEQYRASGEPFVNRPLTVAAILSGLGFDGSALAAGLLHDVIEDTPTTLIEIHDLFGPKVARLVDGVTRISSKSPDIEGHVIQSMASCVAYLPKLTQAIAEDHRVALIQLADRLHNMRTLYALPRSRQMQISWETLVVFVPLAHCFGTVNIEYELQSLALWHSSVPCQSRLGIWFVLFRRYYTTLWPRVSKERFP
jgi:guanosine-3',5'-bis(diphosphate) 3'-pyrophosphohydrolase